MRTFTEILTEAKKNPYKKKVLTKAWAKKVANKWHGVLTNAGDKHGISKERTPEEIVAGSPKIITQSGIKNVFNRFINSAMDDMGANIGSQVWNSMDEKDILKMVNNILSVWNIKGYDKIEGKIPKTDNTGLRLQ